MALFKAKKLAKMKSKDKCPDCRGNGYQAFAGSDFFITEPYDCPACNGSGLYSVWEKRNT